MSSEVVSSGESRSAPAPLEVVTPAASRALFWRAGYLAEDEVLPHVPLLFWLVEALAPRNVVQIGLEPGVAYFALCQALDKLDLAGLCWGIHPAASGDEAELPNAIEAHNAERYEDFSRLVAEAPETAARRFDDGTVDLLCLVAEPGEDLVETLEKIWLPKLSERGVLVIHGLEAYRASRAGETLLGRLRQDHPTVSFDQGKGLLIAGLGKERDNRLEKLFSLRPGEPGHAEVRRVFGRLGRAQELEWRARRGAGRIAYLEKELGQTKKSLSAAQAEGEKDATRLAELTEAYDGRSRATAESQARLFDLQKELETLRETLEAERAEHAEAVAERDRRAEESAERSRAELQNLRDTLETERAEHATALAEATRRTREAEERGATEGKALREALEAERGAREEAANRAAAELQGLRDTLETERADHASALAEARRSAEEAEECSTAELQDLRDTLEAERAEREEALTLRHVSLRESAERIDALEKQVAELETQLGQRQDEVTTLTGMLETARSEQEATRAKEAELQDLRETLDEERAGHVQALGDRNAALTERATRIEELQARIRTIEPALEARYEEIAAMTEMLHAARTAQAEALTQRDAALDDLATLDRRTRQQTEALSTQLAQERSSRQSLSEEVARLEEELGALRTRAAELEAHNESILNSTSWRITGPARRVVNWAQPGK